MEVRPLLRPLGAAGLTRIAGPRGVVAGATIPSARRQQSTTGRTKKALKLPPHPSFLTPSGGANHIVFNPPSAAPSVYHTPFKFLPKTDPRRQDNLSQFLFRSGPALWEEAAAPTPTPTTTTTTSASSGEGEQQPLPPTLTATEEERATPRRNVTLEQVEEMRMLRARDPERWSVLRLAKRYNCTHYFVMMCCSAPAEHQQRERERKEAIRARWGPKRALARAERQKRRALLLRGQL